VDGISRLNKLSTVNDVDISLDSSLRLSPVNIQTPGGEKSKGSPREGEGGEYRRSLKCKKGLRARRTNERTRRRERGGGGRGEQQGLKKDAGSDGRRRGEASSEASMRDKRVLTYRLSFMDRKLRIGCPSQSGSLPLPLARRFFPPPRALPRAISLPPPLRLAYTAARKPLARSPLSLSLSLSLARSLSLSPRP